MLKYLSVTVLLTLATTSVSALTIKASTTTAATTLFTKMFNEYQKRSNATVDFEPGTSPAAQKAILARSVDFAAAIIPLDENEEVRDAEDVLHIPVALSAVVMTYNVPGLERPLNFNGRVLSDIYFGRIKTWNDERIARLNPGVTLPNLLVTPVYRSDPSGYSAIFTNYLTKVSREWEARVNDSVIVDWPVGAATDSEDKSAKAVQAIPGAIGYMGLSRALKDRLTFGNVQNAAGTFVRPTESSIEAAGNSKVTADGTANITYAKVARAYPISNYIYVLLRREQRYAGRTEAQAKATRDLVAWMIDDGQQYNASLYYGELSTDAANRAKKLLATLTFDGKPFR
ncbi:phosphate ABC transporter substrate-binding protein PstS [Deinococcus yavapaiensis]|uniref:Phosphate-binding protein n=1 Tax=Deinococcus yavapaiensis KR-236 TaxID=694435 RepID=A0A318S3F7_9DEIO|nr:phosphate ABC transporter substrate-binding protein PstS [Deinococcus yavapaiensis]PYE50549.1 phosphate transport system substrate-binding protein [Deinococcus yavapaiensis KR-236]